MNRIPPLGLSLFESEVDLLSSPLLLFPVCLLESPPLPPFNLEDEVGGSVIEVVTRGRPFLPRCELSNLSLSPSTKPLTLSSSATFKRPEKNKILCNFLKKWYYSFPHVIIYYRDFFFDLRNEKDRKFLQISFLIFFHNLGFFTQLKKYEKSPPCKISK